MVETLESGRTPAPGDAQLIAQLHALAAGKIGADAGVEGSDTTPPPPPAAAEADTAPGNAPRLDAEADRVPVELPADKSDLLEFMAADLIESAEMLGKAVEQLARESSRSDAIEHLQELTTGLKRTAQFFELASLLEVVEAMSDLASRLGDVGDAAMPGVSGTIASASKTLGDFGEALADGMQPTRSMATLVRALRAAGVPGAEPAAESGAEAADAPADDDTARAYAVANAIAAGSAPTPVSAPASDDPAKAGPAASPPGSAPAAAEPAAEAPTETGASRPTIRVDVDRLEDLLNLVGQLVLNKNRVVSLSRQLGDHQTPHEVVEAFTTASSDLDRLTTELQVGVMRTRMQPLSKLFDRYPRVVRNLARSTGKQMRLDLVGRETEVDKSVIELLGDPLIHMLRNAGDHGLEGPEERRAAGKPEEGVIRLLAEHQGSHVRIEIRDDGRGLDRERLAGKAVERGLVSEAEAAAMSDEDVYRFIFAPGFSTAAAVTDLSGRGVGMDVVRTNINKMNGSVEVRSERGRGTSVEILIPLTVAIMPAMIVGIGAHLYAVPLQSILEIVRPDEKTLSTISGRPVLRLRDEVLPVIDMRERLAEPGEAPARRFAVVTSIAGEQAALLVDQLVGQQEIVIKPLDDASTQGGPFSGATIRENGEVSLILDVMQLIRSSEAESRSRRAA